MKKTACLLLLALLASSADAKNKLVPISEADASKLAGKSLVVTRHKRPAFAAMTAGKAMFGMIGAGAMIVAGNKIIDENKVEDPAAILERELTPALVKHYGLTLKPSASPVISVENPKKIAATQSDTDYILDIYSAGWMFLYYPTDWNSYSVYYTVQVQLIDAKTGTSISKLNCLDNTKKDAHPPSRDALLADGAALLKDVTQSLGWSCAQLTRQQFHLADSDMSATPAQFVDVLGKYAATHTAAAAGAQATAAAAPTAGEAAAAMAAEQSAAAAESDDAEPVDAGQAAPETSESAPDETAAPAPAATPVSL